MSQKITIGNFSSINIVERTKVDSDATAGQAIVNVESAQGLYTNQYAYIGPIGGEKSELKVISTIVNQQVTFTTNLTNAHDRFEDLTLLFGNKIRIYRAANVDGNVPADASFTLLTPVDIDYDQPETEYTDATGSSSYWYKATFYNSTTLAETGLDQAVAQRGGDYGNYCSIDHIRQKSGFKNARKITDVLIDVHRRAAQSEINGELIGRHTLPFTAPVNPTVQMVATLLGAGFLLSEQYNYSTTNPNNMHPFVAEGRAILARIKEGTLSLLDQSGANTAITGASAIHGLPDDASSELLPPKFTMDMRY